MLFRYCMIIAAAFVAMMPLDSIAITAPPNIVVLMTDDLDTRTFDDALALGFLPTIQTEFVQGGMRFDESFVTDALCCPSRATFLTGQYPHNHGVLNISAPEGSFSAFDDSNTLSLWLQNAGYRTSVIGKFLNGYGYSVPKNAPTCTSSDCMKRYIPPGWNDWQAMPDYGELNGTPGYAGAYCMYNTTFNDNGNLVTYGNTDADYQTDVITQRAAALIDSAGSGTSPLFLYLAPLAPHFELCLPAPDQFQEDIRPPPRYVDSLPAYVNLDVSKPSFNEADISDKPSWFGTYFPDLTATQVAGVNRLYRNRLAALRAVDDLLATVKQHLVSAGMWDNTILVFTSDNGWLYGEHRTWGKVFAYDESIRVPLLMRGPGIAPGSHRSAMALNNDLAPTVAAFARVTPGLTCDGRSLLPVIGADNPPDWRRRMLVEHFRDTPPSPVYFYDYLGVRTAAGDAENSGEQILIDWRVDWRINPEPAGIEHYDLVTDPFEIDSLHLQGGSRAQQRAALAADIAVLRDCGKPGHLACLDAERFDDHIYFGGFD